MKLAVFLPNWVGDAVMATPALRALRNHFGSEARLLGVMRPHLRDVLAGTLWLDESLDYDPRSREKSQRTFRVVRELRAWRPDMVLLLTNTLRSAAIAYASGAKSRVGYDRSGRGFLLTKRIAPERVGLRFRPVSALDSYLKLAYSVGCAAEPPRMELATTSADERAADLVWAKLGLPNGSRVVVLNNSGAYGAAKLWPAGHFAALARRIVKELDHSVLVLCGPNERDMAREIVHGAASARVVSLADETASLGLSKACVRRARLLVTTDSGPRHFAAAFGTPVISLFGPTHIAWSETHFADAVHLQIPVDCGPCQKRVCPLGHHRCMRDLTVDHVFSAVAQRMPAAPRILVA